MSEIEGRKGGGGSAHTPVESPDSLQSTSYAKMVLALGEGEFAGELDGQRIFLDGTPLLGADGSENFPNVKWEFRSGTPHQDYIPGMPDVENEIAVNVELTSENNWVRSVSNVLLSAVRLRFSWAQLQQQQDNGDVGGYRIEYAVDIATDGGAYIEVLRTAIDGKTTTKYERSHRIDLPSATTGWQVRVRRLTPNSTSNMIADKMVVEAITEVIDAKLRYPETAILFIQFDAKQFQNIPQVSCEPKGRSIRVPSNYDPNARTYSGTWDGTFKIAWTNNPAWVLYDLMISDRFAIGERVKAENLALTKWDLYAVGQYCDQLVPDGRGGNGVEPRFLCDVYIQSQNDAWKVLRDIAGIFRGVTFWANNNMNALADMPRDIDYTFTRANVLNGKFTYASASEKTHYSTCMVSWSDPANGFQDAVEAVSENSLVRRYGIKQADLTAIGCIRKSEAIRRGKWVLHTNDKDRVVTFTVGLDGKIPLPGWIIGVADEMLAGRPLGGRVSAVAGRNITLDRVSSAAVGERLILNLPSGKAQGRTIAAVSGKTITVTTPFSEVPVSECAWAIDASDLAIQQFRVTGITQNEDGVSYDITATEHDPNKFAKIDTGARIEDPPISVIPPGVQPPPTNVQIGENSATIQGLSVATLRVTWNRAESAIAYEAEWRRDNGNWIPAPRTATLGFEIQGIYAGRYQARVRAINPAEISSIWANAPEAVLSGKIGNPPALASFTTIGQVFGIVLNWEFPAGAEDTQRTEIWYSPNHDGSNALHLGDYAFPQRSHTMSGLAAGVNFWFQARLVDRLGNTGPWTSWVQGTSSDDASEVLGYIKGQITDTELGQDLLAPINDARELKSMWSAKVGQTVDGNPRVGVTVHMRARRTSSRVIVKAPAKAVTDSNGRYSLKVEPGSFDVIITEEGNPPEPVGRITVNPDSIDGPLNDFLTEPREEEVTPEVVAIVNELRSGTRVDADRAVNSANKADESAEVAKNASGNALLLTNLYPSLDGDLGANKAIASGIIKNGSLFNVAVSSEATPPRFADQYQNVAGVAIATGVSYPSSEFVTNGIITAGVTAVSALPNNGFLPGLSSLPLEFNSENGELALGIDDKGRVVVPGGFSDFLGSKMQAIPPESEYSFAIDDESGMVIFGVGKSGFIDILGMRFEVSDIDNILEVIDGSGAIAAGINRNGESLVFSASPPVINPDRKDFPERFHIILYGQSLSIGALGSPILNTPTPDSLMYNTGVISRGKSPASLVQLEEGGVETAASALANSFVSNVKHGMNGRKLILNSGGVGGEKIENLSKGKSAYNDLINQIKWCAQYNRADGREYAVDYIVWIQGEADANLGMSKLEYKARLSQLRIDIENDLSAVRNTARPLQMMIYQMSSHGFYEGTTEHPSVEIPIAHWEISREDENIHCFGPNYMFAGSDQVHKTNHGYRQIGLQAEKAIRHHLETGNKFRPLEPIGFRKISDSVIVGDFYVPVPPMKLDDSIVSQLPDGNNGFEVWDSSGRVGIVNTEVIGSSQLKITTGRALVGEIYVSAAYTPDNRGEATNGWYNSWYAGPKTGVRTTLRDSDTTSTDLIGLDGKVYPRQNYCVIFKMRCE